MSRKAPVHFVYADFVYHSDHSNHSDPVLKLAMNDDFLSLLIITLEFDQGGVIAQNDEIRSLKFRC